MNHPNPSLKEIKQWLNELPTIEDLKQVPGFEISKPYYFVRMGSRWHIGKENSYVDVKNIAGKPDNIQCFADGPDINKRLVGRRDSESPLLNTIRIQAVKRELDNLDKFLCKIGIRKEFVGFTWEKSPQEIYEKQIEDYKKLHNIHNKTETILSFCLCLILVFEVTIIYLNQRKSDSLDTQSYIQLNANIINRLNLEYQKLPSKRKILFLRRTGLSIVSDSESDLESKPLPEFISRYFNTKQLLNEDKDQKTLFLKNLLNEIRKLSKNKS
ncbi:hypothetical protein [Pseudanabaena minima]|uniref:hypothetical protein n=1 Tax=Pseudanabaena minima TaxID=890415 RepID=UPI003DA9968F